MSKKFAGIIVFTIVITVLALIFHQWGIPIISSYVYVMFTLNWIFALVSIILQKLVIYFYRVNVFKEPESVLDYATKYFAIYSSGMNYYVQSILNRLPFVLNKLLAIVFFLFVLFQSFGIIGIYE